MKPLRFTDSSLLKIALNELKTTKKDYITHATKLVNLQKAQELQRIKTTYNTDTDNTKFSKEVIYETPTHLIKATQYGKIKHIEKKKINVIVKKKRVINK